MKITLGTTIKDLRKRNHITQSQLAEQVGVSAAAVSKWESGISLPDITLLPKIAQYLNTTIDSLFDTHQSLSIEDVQKIEDDYRKQFEIKEVQTVMQDIQNYLLENQNSSYLKYRLGYLLFQSIPRLNEEQEAQDMINYIISLFEEICADSNFQYHQEIAFFLSSLYLTNQQLDKASVLLEELPSYTSVRKESLLPSLYLEQGNYSEALELLQSLLFIEIKEVYNTLISLSTTFEKMNDLSSSFLVLKTIKQGNELFQLNSLFSQTDYLLANHYAKQQDTEHTLLYLKKWITYKGKNTELSNHPFFNTIKLKKTDIGENYTSELYLKMLEDNSNFDFLQTDINFQNLINQFKQ